MKFASIDIGSNAVRLLFCNVHEVQGKAVFKKNSLIRVPIRLGEDVFAEKKISQKNIGRLAKAMKAFKLLMDVHEPISFRACATSAMREAENGATAIEHIKNYSGIQIEIVSGKTEAEIIYANHVEQLLEDDKAYLYIDVGGGSTELTIYRNKKITASHSFNIGTIRMLQDKVEKNEWTSLKDWLSTNTKNIDETIYGIGSGGNINKLHSMAGKKNNKALSYERLVEMYQELKKYSYQERVEVLGLNPDRADVIIPASEIFITIMKSVNVKKIFVPEIGLSDGIVHLLYEDYKKKSLQPSLF